ncbi:hypothetical protein [Phenylobacterium sp.]|uniref:hypothetical protein n=1 Tax=Phenylobacterium sp. TaxID=1871053 RepID=UPI002DE87F9D|nr:hypothetical protein [Phenylobacterium sp.]
MTQPPDPETLAKARAAYAQILEDAFRRSPLARIDEWIAAGKAPTATRLRGEGLTTGSGDPERAAELRLARKVFTRTYGFSIPCSDAMGLLSRLGPLVEIGAGSGYWSALLQNGGVDIVATDLTAAGQLAYGFQVGRFCRVEGLTGADAVRAYGDRDVFCSWPTEASPWALGAVRAMAPGRRLALIGEPRGGVTGTPGLFRFLETRFRLLGGLDIPQFPQVRDRLFVYERVG